jgi:heme A synthase
VPALAVPRAVPRAPAAERQVALWLIACCAMVFLMVLIGGVTRLTESGLSITQWQPVTGVVPPLSDAEWQAEFQRYQAIPQYRAIHEGMTLAQFKGIFFWEYLHRLWGRLIGVVFAAPFLYFLARRRIPAGFAPKLAGIFALGALQGVVGWYMVASGLEDRIEVSQYRLALHLAMAVLIYAAMLWVALDLLSPRPNKPYSLSAPGGGEGRGEVGDSRAFPPHPPSASRWVPPSPARRERGFRTMEARPQCSHQCTPTPRAARLPEGPRCRRG